MILSLSPWLIMAKGPAPAVPAGVDLTQRRDGGSPTAEPAAYGVGVCETQAEKVLPAGTESRQHDALDVVDIQHRLERRLRHLGAGDEVGVRLEQHGQGSAPRRHD